MASRLIGYSRLIPAFLKLKFQLNVRGPVMSDTQVNSQITDAVTQTNVKVPDESPAEAMGAVYQTMAQATGLVMQDAVPRSDDGEKPAG
jgi:hypothetical protein